MIYRLWLFVLTALAFFPAHLNASEADVDAASRGVVRVVIFSVDMNRNMRFRSYGTGFAVAENKFVTNFHVVEDATRYRNVFVGVIPPKGDKPTIAKVVGRNSNIDLALVEVTDGLRLPALTFVSNFTSESADVVAVGFPGVVDDVVGLGYEPTVSRGQVSQQRSVRGIDHVLHNAPIARGNSGGPLLDDCGRVIGVNTFGAKSASSEGEFLFAVANSETLALLRENGVSPKTSDLPCRSLAEIEQEEARRVQLEQDLAEQQQLAKEAEEQKRRDEVEAQITEERENMMALAAILLLLGAGASAMAYQASSTENGKNRAIILGVIGGLATLGAAYAWITRPSASDVDDRLNQQMDASALLTDDEGSMGLQPGTFSCTLDTERSRITTSPPRYVEFEWKAEGCHEETQYQMRDGAWSRVFVPQEDYMVRVATIDLASGEFRNERYLLAKTDWQRARDARMSYQPPSCGASNASQRLSDMQESVIALLPDQPNERLIYECESN